MNNCYRSFVAVGRAVVVTARVERRDVIVVPTIADDVVITATLVVLPADVVVTAGASALVDVKGAVDMTEAIVIMVLVGVMLEVTAKVTDAELVGLEVVVPAIDDDVVIAATVVVLPADVVVTAGASALVDVKGAVEATEAGVEDAAQV
jgi:hypothetical protein